MTQDLWCRATIQFFAPHRLRTKENVQPLSVTIIACNEADRIGAAIRSVSFAQEVLVIDSGSADDTVAVAESLGYSSSQRRY